MLFSSTHKTYVYRILFLVWLIISIHVGYRYVSFSSEESIGAKGGTFVEAHVGQINYLPYVTNNDTDKFYQSFLFNGCVYPTVEGTTISYREELCSVSSNDYKSYIVRPLANKTWADGTPFTLNDIYFTYNALLKENYRNIGALDPYRELTVIANEQEGYIEVVFPQASVDNMIFFTNFLMPAHLLANQSLETYITSFYQKPIGTNCAILHPGQYDEDSIIFDLSACPDVSLKFYQVKQFEDQQTLTEYTTGNPEAIDLILDDQGYTGYAVNNVVLNKFATLFFNTQRLPTTLRQQLAHLVKTTFYDTSTESFLVEDHFLFDADSGQTRVNTGLLNDVTQGDIVTTTTTTKQVRTLPSVIYRNTDTQKQQEFVLEDEIEDKISLQMIFPEAYDAVAIRFNEGVEYFPESYDPDTKRTFYNLNPVYRNVAAGTNIYTINAYNNGVLADSFELIVYYLEEPNFPNEELSTDDDIFKAIQIIYFEDTVSVGIANRLEELFAQAGISDFFSFEGFADPDTFAGKIQSKNYDIVIRSISMGLRKDISNLFVTDSPNINPSLYIDEELAAATNEYFLVGETTRVDSKQTIDQRYSENMPLVILGKELGTINIKSSLEFPYPYKLYVLGRRKDFIKDMQQLFTPFSINRDRFKDFSNFKAFLNQN